MKIDYSFWNYFLSLEEDFKEISRYIEFSSDNLKVYSYELLKIFLASSSEFEVVMKEIGAKYKYKKIAGQKNINISKIKDLITETDPLPKMKNMEFCSKYHDLVFTPIDELYESESWWNSYNAVKHKRSMNFPQANLENVLKSMGSLFLANLFLYERDFHNNSCSFDENISIALINLPETSLLRLKNMTYYNLKNVAFLQ